MNLQQSIKRILKEDKDYTKLLKSIIDSSDVFNYKYYCGYDIIHPNERTDQYYFLSKDKIPFLIKVYFVGGPNSEVWPRTQAIQNKELDLMGDLREYITSLVPFNIEMMGSHVNSCNGYEKLMKRKYTTDDLQESIRKILREEDYSPAGKEITPNKIVIHKSNPMFRDKIMSEGLKVRAGECYKIYVGYGVKCKSAIFATNSTNKRAWFDSTYDDDIWEINTEMIPDVKWFKDRHFESRSKHIVTFQNIPVEAITLKYEGTGSGDVEKWGKDSPNLFESIKRILKEETNSKREGLLNIIQENGLYDFTRMTGLKYMDIVFDVGELPRDVKIQYLKDAVSDLQQMPHELDLTMITGSIPLYENDDWQMVYAEYLSNDDNVLKVYVYTFGEDGEDEYDAIVENDIDNETLDILVTELSEKLQHKRDTRI